ncbi:Stp1/IreP family PP2C-type Ser/Thr phosphatase [Fredinandcohnia quinoae]|uniref:protein-serine/threonine phosphatase n=1 Tax=Fredinandcohnia quinoae TaxID=2918902 RepID=A0AAW5E2L9_9BACI|nr:Stp1/IreP family PP2C-type Ser/Thr phosphatase [Fredinandcohnia sp. SECRCQ15]MCH1623830.1 Stp1/IreP family PP2C-type Ser/Thr phosphatase [Fredinandcohnia sp. SECRCQ15]
MNSIYLTNRGKVRRLNEDSCGVFYNKSGQMLATVADGMGGHAAGDVASSMTTSLLQKFWEETDRIDTSEAAEQWLENHITQVNENLYNHSQENVECKGMGTTVIAAICTPQFSSLAHIGDSRCYVLNMSGFKQITEDHSLVNELVRSGHISREDAEHHPRKNVVIRALGTEPSVNMDLKTLILEEGDYLLICSDGLSNKVSDNEMITILENNLSIEQKGEHLIQLANDYGGEDNITLIIIDFSSESEGE